MIMITIIVSACPCALGLAVPLVMAVSAAKASKLGISYQNLNVFEEINALKVICFDKTGTLTTGKMKLHEMIGSKKYANIIYQLEKENDHPLARSFLQSFDQPPATEQLVVTNIEHLAGIGVEGRVNEDFYRLIG